MTTLLEVVTPEDLLAMPDGDHFELVNGELREKDMGALSGWVGNEVAGRIREYSKLHGGWAFGDAVLYRCYDDDPDRVRIPDASYVRAGRLAELPVGFVTIAPDLAVEVISPNDKFYEIEEKVAEYLAAGVRLVWVVSPMSRSVLVYQPGNESIQLGSSRELTGGEVLPGFACRVADLFPPVSSRQASKAPA